jgi:hypothetical protein
MASTQVNNYLNDFHPNYYMDSKSINYLLTVLRNSEIGEHLYGLLPIFAPIPQFSLEITCKPYSSAKTMGFFICIKTIQTILELYLSI